jgi:hypothetical protein
VPFRRYNQVVYALDYFLAGQPPPPRHAADGRPATIQTSVYFAIDSLAAGTLKTQGRWNAGGPFDS